MYDQAVAIVTESRQASISMVQRKLRVGFERVPSHVHHLHRMVADGDTVVTEHSEDWSFAPDHVVSLPFVSI